jgi:hypothetical protein
MQAIAVHPGQPNSMHLRDIPEPGVDEVPGGRGLENYSEMIRAPTNASSGRDG